MSVDRDPGGVQEERCPIVFIHRGRLRWYLWYTVRQAHLVNPYGPVHLITDDDSFPRFPFLHKWDLREYLEAAQPFRDVYRHVHPGPETFERFNFERWLVLRDFLRQHDIGRCAVLDSDTMVYSELARVWKPFEAFELTLTRGCSPHALLVRDWRALSSFCEYVLSIYRRAECEDDLLGAFSEYADASHGALSDMAAFHHYRLLHPDRIGDNHHIRHGALFDNNMHESEGFSMRRGYKYIEWIDGQPYGRRLSDGKLLRFHVLHFQGYAKRRIPAYATCRGARYWLAQPILRLRGPWERLSPRSAGLP